MSSGPASSFRVYKAKAFARFARKARVSDADLWDAVLRANQGFIDADLGGGVIKQRIARQGEGKSGGSRSIILFKKDSRAVFIFGYEKKDLRNIDRRDLEAYRDLASVILNYSEIEIEKQVEKGTLLRMADSEESHG